METKQTAYNPQQTTYLGRAVQKKRGPRALREIAEEVGEPYSTVFHIENGRMPSPASFIGLLRWLNVVDAGTFRKLMKYASPEKNQ